MPDSDYPVRCEFWGDEITDLSYFDIETQRRFKKADKITLSPSTEIVIEDRAALADKIEHKAKLLRSKNSAKAKEKLFSEAELIRSGAMIANADKFINQIYDKPESLFDYLDRNTFVLRLNLLQFRNGESQWTLSAMKPLCKALRTELFAEVLTALRSHSTNVPSFCKVTEQSCLKTLFTEVCLSSCRKSSAFQQNSSRHGGSYKQLKEDVDGLFTPESKGVIFAGTEIAAKNLCDTFNADGINAVYSEGADKISKGELLVTAGCIECRALSIRHKSFLQ